MAHYQRFLLTDEAPFSLAQLDAGLKRADPAWAVADVSPRPAETGTLSFNGERCGLLELNRAGEEIFKEELQELVDIVRWTPGPQQTVVQQTLNKTKAILALESSWDDREPADSERMLAPLWDWLFAHRKGLKHEDGRGFSDATGVILEIR